MGLNPHLPWTYDLRHGRGPKPHIRKLKLSNIWYAESGRGSTEHVFAWGLSPRYAYLQWERSRHEARRSIPMTGAWL